MWKWFQSNAPIFCREQVYSIMNKSLPGHDKHLWQDLDLLTNLGLILLTLAYQLIGQNNELEYVFFYFCRMSGPLQVHIYTLMDNNWKTKIPVWRSKITSTSVCVLCWLHTKPTSGSDRVSCYEQKFFFDEVWFWLWLCWITSILFDVFLINCDFWPLNTLQNLVTGSTHFNYIRATCAFQGKEPNQAFSLV